MAGQPAGRLYVEILADIAKLQKDLDTAKRQVRSAANDMGTSAEMASGKINGMASAMGQVNTMSRAQRANLINLGRQVQDVGTMFALGASPMQIFASQGAQVADVLVMMNAEAKATGTSLSGMAVRGLGAIAPYALAAGAAIGVTAAALSTITDQINENSDVTVTWGDVVLGTFDMIAEATQSVVVEAFEQMGLDIDSIWSATATSTYALGNAIINTFRFAYRAFENQWNNFPAVYENLVVSGLNAGIKAVEAFLNASISGINAFIRDANNALGTNFQQFAPFDLGQIANRSAGAGQRYAEGFLSGMEVFSRDNFAEFADAVSPYAQARARSRIENSAKEGGKRTGRTAGRAMGEAAAEEYPKAFLEAVAANLDAVNKSVREQVQAYGQRNQATEQAIAALQRELEQLTLTEAELRQLEIARLMEGAATNEQREALDRLNAARETAINDARRLREEEQENAAAAAAYAAQIDRVARNLGLLGGLFGQDAGALVNSVLQTEIVVKDSQGKDVSQTIGESIARAFQTEGKNLAETLGQAIQNAVIGGLASQAVLGSAGSGTGAAIGGALGGAAAGQFLGKALGSFAGPLGSIAGGIVGGLVGGLFKGKERASATVSGIAGQAMQNAISGDNAQLRGVADSLAQGLIGGLGNIAEALGGEIGNFAAISIGTRKGTFRVDTSGQGRTAKMPSFQTEAEAVAFALQTAIERGAITGLRAGTEALLRGAGDLQAGLEKALAFEDVFKRLERETDPLAFALGELETEFNQLRRLFDEAGASAEEYAQLEQLYQIERDKAMEQFGESVAENLELIRDQRRLEIRIMELQGMSAEALAAARQMELDAAGESLRGLMQQVYALEDQARAASEAAAAQEEAARIAEQAAQEILAAERAIANERFGLETRLLQLLGKTAELREREIAALDPSNQALLRQIFAIEDHNKIVEMAARAAEELARAQEEAAEAQRRAAETTRNLTIRLLEAEGNALAAVAMRREDELAELSESDRAILKRIFALEDQRTAEEAATRATQEAVRAAEEKAQAEQRAADITRGLTIRLLEAQGNAEAALAIRRQEELAGLNASDQAIARQIFALEDAATAQREYEEALQATRDSLAEQRQAIESELSPLRSELARLVDAVTPEQQDLVAAMRIRDVSSEGLALAARLADAAKSIFGDNAQITAATSAAARRELFRMVETRRFDAGRAEQLIGAASNFSGQFADPVEQLRQQALTANTLTTIADAQEQISLAEQAAEERRAAEARAQVLQQIEALEFQITQGEASLRALDNIESNLSIQRDEDRQRGQQTIAELKKQNANQAAQIELMTKLLNEAVKGNRLLDQIEFNGASA